MCFVCSSTTQEQASDYPFFEAPLLSHGCRIASDSCGASRRRLPGNVIEKRGTPKAVLLSIRDHVRLVAPEPDVLRIIGEESKRNGTNSMTAPD
jgi:hypothetical protein